MTSFRKSKVPLLAALIAVALSLPVFAYDAKEEKVSLEDCPEAVQKTIKESAKGGRIVEIEKETKKDGSLVYEAEIKHADGKEVEVTVASDGTLLAVEIEEDEDDDDKEDDDD